MRASLHSALVPKGCNFIASTLTNMQQFLIIVLSVFTSTVNVVFQGREIIDGNEKSHLWVEDGQYLDYYSKTKEQAEKIVIESNCQKTKNGKNVLRTCVLR